MPASPRLTVLFAWTVLSTVCVSFCTRSNGPEAQLSCQACLCVVVIHLGAQVSAECCSAKRSVLGYGQTDVSLRVHPCRAVRPRESVGWRDRSVKTLSPRLLLCLAAPSPCKSWKRATVMTTLQSPASWIGSRQSLACCDAGDNCRQMLSECCAVLSRDITSGRGPRQPMTSLNSTGTAS